MFMFVIPPLSLRAKRGKPVNKKVAAYAADIFITWMPWLNHGMTIVCKCNQKTLSPHGLTVGSRSIMQISYLYLDCFVCVAALCAQHSLAMTTVKGDTATMILMHSLIIYGNPIIKNCTSCPGRKTHRNDFVLRCCRWKNAAQIFPCHNVL